jgi:DNA replication protein DnaC
LDIDLSHIELTDEEQFAIMLKARKDKHYNLQKHRANELIKSGMPVLESYERAQKEIVLEDITLTEEEEEPYMIKAKKIKHANMISVTYFRKINAPQETKHNVSESKFYDAVIHRLFKLVGKYEPTNENLGKIIFDQNREQFEQLFYYFAHSTKSKLDPDKGIYLVGNVGCGKTYLMDIFQANSYHSFNIVSCRTVAADYQKGTYSGIEKYFQLQKSLFIKDYHTGWCFDDLGAEDKRKSFGDSMNVMEEVIANVYENKRKKILNFNQFHMTSNLSKDEVIDIYGTRFDSRIGEMFNIVVFPVDTIDLRTVK